MFFVFSGCRGLYLLESATEFGDILRRQRPVGESLSDPKLPDSTKDKIRTALAAKAFAESHMGLKVTRNYSQFVNLDRPYVSTLVFAAEKCRLKTHQWNFPLVGAVPYLGFAREDRAWVEAKKMEDQGLDTYVRGTVAFSTLGWVEDPLLSTFLRLNELDLINTVIHELIHSTLFIAGASQFNEGLASFWAEKGTADYLKAHGRSVEYQAYLEASRRERLVARALKVEIQKLRDWYQQQPAQGCDELERKQKLAELPSAVLRTLGSRDLTSLPTALRQGTALNNATLVALQTYDDSYEIFETIWTEAQGDHATFLRKVRDQKNRLVDLTQDVTTRNPR